MRITRIAMVLLMGILLVASILAGCIKPGPIVEGVVDHKSVTGVKDDTSYTILLNRPSDEGPWILVEDKDYEEFFSEEDRHAVINKSLEDEMKTKYSSINYLVSVRLNSEDTVNNLKEGDTLAYFVNRDDFNKVKIEDEVKFEVSRSAIATIERFLEVYTRYRVKVTNNSSSEITDILLEMVGAEGSMSIDTLAKGESTVYYDFLLETVGEDEPIPFTYGDYIASYTQQGAEKGILIVKPATRIMICIDDAHYYVEADK